MEKPDKIEIPLELLITLCARSFISGGTINDIDSFSLEEMATQINLELEKREATYTLTNPQDKERLQKAKDRLAPSRERRC
jgi:hypothetical protein